MLVVHGNWTDGRLHIWGETLPSVTRAEVAKAASASDGGHPPRSPFDATASALASVVTAFAGSSRESRMRHARLAAIALPTAGDLPVPSRMDLMPMDWELDPGGRVMRLWTVTTLPLSFPEAASLFAICARVDDPCEALARGVRAGRDLAALARLWRLAGAVVARQRVAPAIEDGRSRWLPVLDRADARRLENIVHDVPQSAFSHLGMGASGAGSTASSAHGFFEDAVDAIVRHSVTTPLSRLHASRGSFHDLHSAFLASLRSSSGLIRWKQREETNAFAEVLAEWRRPLYTTLNGLHLGFRLREPTSRASERPIWRLDPVAVGEGDAIPLTPANLARFDAATRENLLISLGQASALCPALLEDEFDTESSVPLDSTEVTLFLREQAPLLKAAGFGVFSPSWWTPSPSADGRGERDATRLAIRAVSARFPAAGKGAFSLDTVVDVKWEVALGDATLTREDIEKLLASGKPLVRWRSRWLYADRARLAAAAERLRALEGEELTVRRLVHLSASGAYGADIAVDVSRVERNKAFASLVAGLRSGAGMGEVPQPASLAGELRPYQGRALSWLAFLARWGFGACLADDMGLGKTIEAIAMFLHMRDEGVGGPILVVCPMSIMTKWQRELARFAPSLTSWIFHGHDRPRDKRDFEREALAHDVTIADYGLLSSDFAAFQNVTWAVAALDEAQNIKNPATRKSRTARALRARLRIALTGTPIENGAGDLWAIMDFLNPGLLPPRAAFAERFLRPISLSSDTSARSALKRIVSPFILRRLKTDKEIISDLPPRIEEKVYCPLTKEQASLYAAEVRDAKGVFSGPATRSRRGNVLALLTRLKQICNHPEHYFAREAAAAPPAAGAPSADPLAASRSGKVRRLDELLGEVIAGGERALVFTQYAVMGDLLRRHLRARLGVDIPFLQGSTPIRERDAMVSRFQREDGPPVFILSIRAGGTGLDLTRANHVFHFDRWWNPAVENQATDRAHRIGQDKTVFVHTFICDGTLESRIDELISGKSMLAGEIVGSGDGWLSKLSADQLRSIVALSSSATEFAEEDEP